MDYLTTHTSLSSIRREFAPGFGNYKKGCTRLAAASDKVYQLLNHRRWFSPGTPASSTTKTTRHDIAEILLKVELNTINQSNRILDHVRFSFFRMATTNTKYLFFYFFSCIHICQKFYGIRCVSCLTDTCLVFFVDIRCVSRLVDTCFVLYTDIRCVS